VTRITGTIPEDLCLYMKISHSVLLRMTKCFRQKLSRKSLHFMFSNFFLKLFLVWDNVEKVVQQDRQQMTI